MLGVKLASVPSCSCPQTLARRGLCGVTSTPLGTINCTSQFFTLLELTLTLRVHREPAPAPEGNHLPVSALTYIVALVPLGNEGSQHASPVSVSHVDPAGGWDRH